MRIVACLLPLAATMVFRSAAADIASANFDDGTSGPFTPVGRVTFPVDPTNSGHGRVAQFQYTADSTPADIYSSLVVHPPRKYGFGSTVFFAGDLYIPRGTYNISNPAVDRKLFSFRATGVVPADMLDTANVFVTGHIYGCGILLEWSGLYAGNACALRTIAMGQWYHVEVQVTMNSSMSASDGKLRVWIDGRLTVEDTAVRLTKPTWTGAPVWDSFIVGEHRRSANFPGHDDLSDGSAIDESRYWDNIVFSETRVAATRP